MGEYQFGGIRLHDVAATPDGVRLLRRSLYGLCNAGKDWNDLLAEKLTAFGFTKLPSDPGVYRLERGGKVVIIPIHVDDGLVFGNDKGLMDEVFGMLEENWKVKRDNEAKFFLGIRIRRDRKERVMDVDVTVFTRFITRRACQTVGC